MTRLIDFRYYVVRNGANYCEIHAVEGAEPKILMEDGSGIKTKLSGSFLVPAEDVDWLTDEIRPVMVIDGTEHHLGIFLPANVSETETDTSNRVSIDAYDRGWIVKDHRTEYTLFFPAGSNYLSVVGSVLAECGITLISMVPTDETLAEDRADWDVGTSSLDIVNQLLAEINYEELYFDPDGVAVLEPKSTPSANNVEHILDEASVESLMIPGIQKTTDFHSAPNVFICVCSNADKSQPLVSRAENTNPQSPLSIARRGRRIMKRIQVDNIENQAALDAYAQRICNESMIGGETIRVQTGLLPGFGVADVTALRFEGIDTLCVEKAWTMDLGVGGNMQHTLQRVVINLD